MPSFSVLTIRDDGGYGYRWISFPDQFTIFKLESGGVLSAEIALYNIPGQDSFLFGIDSAGMSWGEIYQGVSLAGNASGGSSWTEVSYNSRYVW